MLTQNDCNDRFFLFLSLPLSFSLSLFLSLFLFLFLSLSLSLSLSLFYYLFLDSLLKTNMSSTSSSQTATGKLEHLRGDLSVIRTRANRQTSSKFGTIDHNGRSLHYPAMRHPDNPRKRATVGFPLRHQRCAMYASVTETTASRLSSGRWWCGQ